MASARTLHPESISITAPTPARGKLCWQVRLRSQKKVQTQAPLAQTPHPWCQEMKMALNEIKEGFQALIRLVNGQRGHFFSKGVLVVWAGAEQQG